MAQDTHSDFAAAVGWMTDGELGRARTALEGLTASPDTPNWAAAMAYLGEVQWLMGDRQSARATFQRLATERPSYQMSPYQHVEEVRAQYALIRQRVQPGVVLDAKQKFQLVTWAPFGVAQASQGRRGAATRFGILHGTLALGSIGTFYALDQINRSPARSKTGWTREQTTRRTRALRFGAQLPLTLAFYTTWGLSVRDAHRYRSRQKPQPSRP